MLSQETLSWGKVQKFPYDIEVHLYISTNFYWYRDHLDNRCRKVEFRWRETVKLQT
jgi:hypothetical protein